MRNQTSAARLERDPTSRQRELAAVALPGPLGAALDAVLGRASLPPAAICLSWISAPSMPSSWRSLEAAFAAGPTRCRSARVCSKSCTARGLPGDEAPGREPAPSVPSLHLGCWLHRLGRRGSGGAGGIGAGRVGRRGPLLGARGGAAAAGARRAGARAARKAARRQGVRS